MAITKASWRYDPKTQRYISGRQGGGYIQQEGGKFYWYDNVGRREISGEELQRQISRGERAEGLRRVQQSRRLRKEKGEEGIEPIESEHGWSYTIPKERELYEHVKSTAEQMAEKLQEKQIAVAFGIAPTSSQYELYQEKIDRGEDPSIATQEIDFMERQQAFKTWGEMREQAPTAKEKQKEFEYQQWKAKSLKEKFETTKKEGIQLAAFYPHIKTVKEAVKETSEKIRKTKWVQKEKEKYYKLKTLAKTGVYPTETKDYKHQYYRGTEGTGIIGTIVGKAGEKWREERIEKATQFTIARIRKQKRGIPEQKIGIFKGEFTLPSKTRAELVKETRVAGEFTKGASTGITTSIREKPIKLAAIAGAAYLTTGLLAPAIKGGAASVVLKAPIARPLKYAGKAVALGTKAGLVGAYGGTVVYRFKAAPTPYAKGKVFGEVGTELGAIYAGGLTGMKFGVKPVQRWATFKSAQVEGLESKYLTEVMEKGYPATKLHGATVPKKYWKQLTGRELAIVKGRTLFGARGQRLWMTKDSKWLQPGTIKRMTIGKQIRYTGKPRVMKDIDVILKPYESQAGFIKKAKALGFKADPHPHADLIKRGIPGISKRPIKFGEYKVMSPGEQVARKYLGLVSVRKSPAGQLEYYRFGKDLPDFLAGAKVLAKHGVHRYTKLPYGGIKKAKALAGIKAIEQIPFPKTQKTAWWLSKKPKVMIKDWAKTVTMKPSLSSSFAASVIPSYFASKPSKYKYSTSQYMSPSVSPYPSPSVSLSPSQSISLSISPSPSRSPSVSPSLSRSLSVSPSSSLSPSLSSSLYPSPSSITPPVPTLWTPKKMKVSRIKKPKRKKLKPKTKYLPTLHFAVAPLKYKKLFPKKKPKIKVLTGLEERY